MAGYGAQPGSWARQQQTKSSAAASTGRRPTSSLGSLKAWSCIGRRATTARIRLAERRCSSIRGGPGASTLRRTKWQKRPFKWPNLSGKPGPSGRDRQAKRDCDGSQPPAPSPGRQFDGAAAVDIRTPAISGKHGEEPGDARDAWLPSRPQGRRVASPALPTHRLSSFWAKTPVIWATSSGLPQWFAKMAKRKGTSRPRSCAVQPAERGSRGLAEGEDARPAWKSGAGVGSRHLAQ